MKTIYIHEKTTDLPQADVLAAVDEATGGVLPMDVLKHEIMPFLGDQKETTVVEAMESYKMQPRNPRQELHNCCKGTCGPCGAC